MGGLNWSQGFKGAARGLGDMINVKQNQAEMEYRNLHDANVRRYQTEDSAARRAEAIEDRDLKNQREDEMLNPNSERGKGYVAQQREIRAVETEARNTEEGFRQEGREKIEEIRAERYNKEKATQIFGTISASGIWTPESMEKVRAFHDENGFINYSLLEFAPEKKRSLQETLLSVTESLSKQKVSDAELQRALGQVEEVWNRWDKFNANNNPSRAGDMPPVPADTPFSDTFGGNTQPGTSQEQKLENSDPLNLRNQQNP